jgi:hypothetical protein
MAGEDIKGWRDQFDLDLGIASVIRFSCSQRIFHGVNAIIAKTSDFDVRTDFGGMRGELFADVRLEFVLGLLARERNIVPYAWITVRMSVLKPSKTRGFCR